jgi:gas vesicle protein
MSDTSIFAGGSDPGADGESTASVARDQAAHVAESAAESGQHVVDVAKDEASNVAEEAKTQAQDLFAQAQGSLRDQAAQQQERVAAGLHAVSDELSQMAAASESHGVGSELARQASERASGIASWLDKRDPGSLLSEVKSYARRNPGTFIAVAAVAGALAGRLTRSVASGTPDTDSSTAEHPGTSDSSATGRPAETPERAPMRPPTARVVPADSAEPAVGPDVLVDVSDDTSYGGRL